MDTAVFVCDQKADSCPFAVRAVMTTDDRARGMTELQASVKLMADHPLPPDLAVSVAGTGNPRMTINSDRTVVEIQGRVRDTWGIQVFGSIAVRGADLRICADVTAKSDELSGITVIKQCS
ncbi:hypothetical protein [Sphaerimonospora thailandensis]|nr:hypothetical protein [Sphaerimonospora thailandensis]